MAKITAIDAFEILDSRGNPTLRVQLRLDNGIAVSSSVPSGASPGSMRRSNCATATNRVTAARAC